MENSAISGNKTRRKRWEFGGPGLHYSSNNCHHPSGQPPVAPWIEPRTCDQPRKRGFSAQGCFWWRKFHYLAIKKRGCEPYKLLFIKFLLDGPNSRGEKLLKSPDSDSGSSW